MSRAVLPRRSAWAEQLLTGTSDDVPSSEVRAVQLDVVDEEEAAFWLARASEPYPDG